MRCHPSFLFVTQLMWKLHKEMGAISRSVAFKDKIEISTIPVVSSFKTWKISVHQDIPECWKKINSYLQKSFWQAQAWFLWVRRKGKIICKHKTRKSWHMRYCSLWEHCSSCLNKKARTKREVMTQSIAVYGNIAKVA